MINCIIIDDEPLALDLLESYISKISFLNLIARYNEPLTALDYANTHEVDLLFIDIQMPDITGIDFFKALPKKPEVIFTTAFSEFALEGFNLSAIDYLLKPISFERFIFAANRAKDFHDYKNSRQNHPKDYFFINAAHKIHKIFYENVLYLEGLKDYTKIHLADHKHPLVVLQNLKFFEDSLPKEKFVRVHRSYIVSLNRLNTITKKVVAIGERDIPVSDNYRERLFSLIN